MSELGRWQNNTLELSLTDQDSQSPVMVAMSSSRVCVVGAGMAGLAAIKECKHVGLDPVCYELNSDLG
ncbi:hypothetical protein RRG08_059512 [Elysia crispata]|uniref:Flavin-containing monooxygenase n=1 Tax=Elysia crispata TaxID=231223 RepID=A0AAE0YP09_9GAST|nr:hypothetical protein RRG08_059512 [Elysia crispata]